MVGYTAMGALGVQLLIGYTGLITWGMPRSSLWALTPAPFWSFSFHGPIFSRTLVSLIRSALLSRES